MQKERVSVLCVATMGRMRTRGWKPRGRPIYLKIRKNILDTPESPNCPWME